jgi:uncharacterized membrane protein
VILGVTASIPYLFAAAITGFLLVAPMLAAGLYELSRRYLAGEPASLVDSMLAWRRNPSGLVGFRACCRSLPAPPGRWLRW